MNCIFWSLPPFGQWVCDKSHGQFLIIPGGYQQPRSLLFVHSCDLCSFFSMNVHKSPMNLSGIYFLIITSLWSVGLRQISRSFFLHEWQRQRNRKTEGFMPPWNVGGHRQNVLCWIKKDTEGLLSARTMVRLWHLRQTIGLRHLRGCAFIYTAHPLVFYDWNVYLYFRLNRFGTCSFCLKTLFEPEFWHDLLEFVCVDNSLMRSSIVQNYSKTRGMQNKVAFWGQ